jgi:hypothetical protein
MVGYSEANFGNAVAGTVDQSHLSEEMDMN